LALSFLPFFLPLLPCIMNYLPSFLQSWSVFLLFFFPSGPLRSSKTASYPPLPTGPLSMFFPLFFLSLSGMMVYFPFCFFHLPGIGLDLPLNGFPVGNFPTFGVRVDLSPPFLSRFFPPTPPASFFFPARGGFASPAEILGDSAGLAACPPKREPDCFF